MMVGILRPHVPWYVPEQWFDLYDNEVGNDIVTISYGDRKWEYDFGKNTVSEAVKK